MTGRNLILELTGHPGVNLQEKLYCLQIHKALIWQTEHETLAHEKSKRFK